MQTFKDFISTYQNINHRFGDLATDISLDEDFPDSTDFYDNLQHLIDNEACSDFINTFYDAWMTYQKFPKDQTALYISMLMEKIDILIGVNGQIADHLGVLADGQDPDNPLVSISDEIEALNDDDGYGAIAMIRSELGQLNEQIEGVTGQHYTGGGLENVLRVTGVN